MAIYWVVLDDSDWVRSLLPAYTLRLAAGDPHMTGALLGGLCARCGRRRLGTNPAIFNAQLRSVLTDTLIGLWRRGYAGSNVVFIGLSALDTAADQGAQVTGWRGVLLVVAFITGRSGLLMMRGCAPMKFLVKGLRARPIRNQY